ncbi:GNAT family N-acetyltransferase [Flavobacterium sp. ASW18X]|uniref:GNAT family N-acetyltransferase n=1 Tax=Flavobacterium sp. ASW18X TaxID=2572595 RepID=UPI0010ADDE17|nr:GNAT family N-acetyltransferase [Flavobacterium sp. ASW18X]TKD65208.1 GNAT family N-acetyltransferase [Flavobacterium sp. ASW18X]
MIRPATQKDISPLLSVTKACAASMIAHGIYQWNEHYPSQNAFEKDLERKELYVLEVAGAIMGSIVISNLKDDEYQSIAWLTEEGRNFYIHRLCVHPNLQGQGYARQLMNFAEEEVRKQGGISVRLDTFSKNKRNQRFYEARGYQKLGNIYFPKQSTAPFYCYELILEHAK